MASQSERRSVTRGRLIAAARACFLEVGYENASTGVILERAGVSKGALYHHFESKDDLLAAVFSEVSRETVDKASRLVTPGTSSIDSIAAVLKAWSRFVSEPEPRKIILETGPAVLGLSKARQIEEAVIQAPFRTAIARGIAKGEIGQLDIDLTTRILSAAVGELALATLHRGAASQSPDSVDQIIDRLIAALLVPPADGQNSVRAQ